MSTVKITRSVLECDGCTAVFGAPKGFVSQMEARAAAYAERWRFPHVIDPRTGNNRPTCSDVCPECIGDWEPRTSGPSQRQATQDEMRRWT